MGRRRQLGISRSSQRRGMTVYAKVPSLSSLRQYENELPNRLSDEHLIRHYASLQATKYAYIRGSLPNSFYTTLIDSSASGKVPKDVFLLTNLNETIRDFSSEIEKRGLQNKFIVII